MTQSLSLRGYAGFETSHYAILNGSNSCRVSLKRKTIYACWFNVCALNSMYLQYEREFHVSFYNVHV